MLADTHTDKLQKIVAFISSSSGLNYPQLAEKADVPIADLVTALKGDNPNRSQVYNKIVEGLGYSVNDLQKVMDFTQSHLELVKLIIKLEEIDQMIVSAPSEPTMTKPTNVLVMNHTRVGSRRTKTEKLIQEMIGRELRRYRESNRLSQVELAEKMGIHQSTVSGLERGIYPVRSSSTFLHAFNKIGTDLDALIEKAEQRVAQRVSNAKSAQITPDFDERDVFRMIQSIRTNPDLQVYEQEIRGVIGEELKKRRMMNGFAPIDVAEKAKVSISVVENIESGDYPLPDGQGLVALWKRIADLYKYPLMENLYKWLKDKTAHVI